MHYKVHYKAQLIHQNYFYNALHIKALSKVCSTTVSQLFLQTYLLNADSKTKYNNVINNVCQFSIFSINSAFSKYAFTSFKQIFKCLMNI